MSDPFDAAFTALRGQRPPRPFAPAAEVRRRGHQRAFRQTVVAGAVVFAVTAAGAGWAAVPLPHGPGRQQPAATPSPSVPPSVAPSSPPPPPAPPPPDGSATTHDAVVDTGFAGDQALLVQEDIRTYGTDRKLQTDTSFAAVVRVGDLVTTVRASSNFDRNAVRALAVKAADR